MTTSSSAVGETNPAANLTTKMIRERREMGETEALAVVTKRRVAIDS